MWVFAPCDKEDKIMSSGGEAFLALPSEIPSCEKMKAFGSTSQCRLLYLQKKKWKMRKEAQVDLVLCHCDRMLFISVCSAD